MRKLRSFGYRTRRKADLLVARTAILSEELGQVIMACLREEKTLPVAQNYLVLTTGARAKFRYSFQVDDHRAINSSKGSGVEMLFDFADGFSFLV